jgi:glycosyltransferase involved in cell wall biosynthesis
MNSKRPLIVFSDDWGRHPSSCQHLVSHLVEDFDVTWVNTIGTRLPALDRASVRRAFEKVREWTSRRPPDDSPADRVSVLSPIMWPTFRTSFARRVNRRLISQHLLRRVPDLSSSTMLTTVPVAADLVGKVPAARWIYYCVDDFSEWPGLDGKTLRSMEKDLIRSVDCVVAAGDRLADRIRALGRAPVVITHGVDLSLWSGAASDAQRLPSLAGVDHPIVLFWGLIDARLDVEWLTALAQGMERGTIVLMGPEQNANPILKHAPRIVMTGPVPFCDLPAAAASADVLIMPYADLPVTRAMQPLKLKEYLATGKPVVVSPLPAVADWRECLDIADDAASFVRLVIHRLQSGTPIDHQLARQQLATETWKQKALKLRQLLE